MKHYYLKGILLCLSLFIGINVLAYDASVGGIYYNLDPIKKEAEVTYLERRINDDYSAYIFISDYHDTVIIPESITSHGKTYKVTSIGDHAFVSCSGLTSVTIPKSVISISDYSFAGCSGLNAITIPNGVTSIGDNAFQNSSGLTSVIIGSSVTSLGNDAFRDCKSLTSITIGNSVKSIGDDAFNGCFGLTSITIPNSATSIGNSAFYNCYRLTSINVPNSVTSIGKYAFDGTAWYDNQPNGLIYAGKVVYRYKGTMPEGYEIVIDEGTLGIVHGAFSGCTGLTSITIPKSVANIGGQAFQGCTGLTSINVATENKTYDSRENCNAIITTATNSLFVGCKNTVIPNSVISIERYSFSGCSSLTSITIPNSVTSIGIYAFYGCTRLTSVTISNSVKSIGLNAFCDCTSLTSIIIPNSVTKIDGCAFSGCSCLTSVTIGNGVKSIENFAFQGCSGLTDVYCLAEDAPKTQNYAFLSSSIKSATLYVPAVSIDTYSSALPWSGFGTIVGLTDDEIDGIKEIKNEELKMNNDSLWYDLSGRKLDKPQKGINIIRHSDGTSRKVLVK